MVWQEYLKKYSGEILNNINTLTSGDIIPETNLDIPLQYTFIVKPDTAYIYKIKTIQEELKEIDSNLYYYDPDNLHMTLLGGLPAEIEITQDVENVLREIIRYKSLTNFGYGVGSSVNSAAIVMYPDYDLLELRNDIRKAFGHNGTDYSTRREFFESIGWMTIVRYTKPVSAKFLEKLQELQDIEFGVLDSAKVYLVKTDSRVLEPRRSEIINEIDLF